MPAKTEAATTTCDPAFECAACAGQAPIINTVWWGLTPVDLCTACMILGSGDARPDEVAELLATRANPEADPNEAEARVGDWLARQQKKEATDV